MTDDERAPFALRHQARRAALLADLLREHWNLLGWGEGFDHGDLPTEASRMSDEAWANAAAEIERRTGAPFKVPSDTTKAITIGLLSAPELKGLVS